MALVLRYYAAVDLLDKEDRKKFITDKPSVIESISKAEKIDPLSDLKIKSVLKELILDEIIV